jgi:hypothetical protein
MIQTDFGGGTREFRVVIKLSGVLIHDYLSAEF